MTALLAHCATPGDAAFWWSQPVGVRTAALLRLVALTEQPRSPGAVGALRAAGCGEAFEFELPLLAAGRAGAADDGPVQVALPDGRSDDAAAHRRATCAAGAPRSRHRATRRCA